MSYLSYLKELEKSQWLKRDQIQNIQSKKLKYLVNHAYKSISYYNSVFKNNNLKIDDIRSIGDISKIPIQRRSSLKSDLNKLINLSYRKGKVLKNFTSGSTTGERLTIYKDHDLINKYVAAEMRAYGWYKIDYLHEKFYYLIGADYDIKKEKKLGNKLKFFLSNTIKLSPLHLKTDKFEVFLTKIKKTKRRVLYSTPTGGCTLIDELKKRNQKIDIDVFISTDYPILKQQRRYIKDFFNCEIYDIYGTSEVWSVAFECPEHRGYHLTSENIIMDVVDDDNQPVAPGEKGHVLLTDLNNLVMPFIRYDIGDIGILSDECCSCGRGLHIMKPVFDQIIYRESDYILSSDNKKVWLPELSFILDDFSKISNFQIIQNKTKEIELIIVKEAGYNNEYEEHIKSSLTKKLGDLGISFNYLDYISPDRNGKQVYIKK